MKGWTLQYSLDKDVGYLKQAYSLVLDMHIHTQEEASSGQ